MPHLLVQCNATEAAARGAKSPLRRAPQPVASDSTERATPRALTPPRVQNAHQNHRGDGEAGGGVSDTVARSLQLVQRAVDLQEEGLDRGHAAKEEDSTSSLTLQMHHDHLKEAEAAEGWASGAAAAPFHETAKETFPTNANAAKQPEKSHSKREEEEELTPSSRPLPGERCNITRARRPREVPNKDHGTRLQRASCKEHHTLAYSSSAPSYALSPPLPPPSLPPESLLYPPPPSLYEENHPYTVPYPLSYPSPPHALPLPSQPPYAPASSPHSAPPYGTRTGVCGRLPCANTTYDTDNSSVSPTKQLAMLPSCAPLTAVPQSTASLLPHRTPTRAVFSSESSLLDVTPRRRGEGLLIPSAGAAVETRDDTQDKERDEEERRGGCCCCCCKKRLNLEAERAQAAASAWDYYHFWASQQQQQQHVQMTPLQLPYYTHHYHSALPLPYEAYPPLACDAYSSYAHTPLPLGVPQDDAKAAPLSPARLDDNAERVEGGGTEETHTRWSRGGGPLLPTQPRPAKKRDEEEQHIPSLPAVSSWRTTTAKTTTTTTTPPSTTPSRKKTSPKGSNAGYEGVETPTKALKDHTPPTVRKSNALLIADEDKNGLLPSQEKGSGEDSTARDGQSQQYTAETYSMPPSTWGDANSFYYYMQQQQGATGVSRSPAEYTTTPGGYLPHASSTFPYGVLRKSFPYTGIGVGDGSGGGGGGYLPSSLSYPPLDAAPQVYESRFPPPPYFALPPPPRCVGEEYETTATSPVKRYTNVKENEMTAKSLGELGHGEETMAKAFTERQKDSGARSQAIQPTQPVKPFGEVPQRTAQAEAEEPPVQRPVPSTPAALATMGLPPRSKPSSLQRPSFEAPSRSPPLACAESTPITRLTGSRRTGGGPEVKSSTLPPPSPTSRSVVGATAHSTTPSMSFLRVVDPSMSFLRVVDPSMSFLRVVEVLTPPISPLKHPKPTTSTAWPTVRGSSPVIVEGTPGESDAPSTAGTLCPNARTTPQLLLAEDSPPPKMPGGAVQPWKPSATPVLPASTTNFSATNTTTNTPHLVRRGIPSLSRQNSEERSVTRPDTTCSISFQGKVYTVSLSAFHKAFAAALEGESSDGELGAGTTAGEAGERALFSAKDRERQQLPDTTKSSPQQGEEREQGATASPQENTEHEVHGGAVTESDSTALKAKESKTEEPHEEGSQPPLQPARGDAAERGTEANRMTTASSRSRCSSAVSASSSLTRIQLWRLNYLLSSCSEKQQREVRSSALGSSHGELDSEETPYSSPLLQHHHPRRFHTTVGSDGISLAADRRWCTPGSYAGSSPVQGFSTCSSPSVVSKGGLPSSPLSFTSLSGRRRSSINTPMDELNCDPAAAREGGELCRHGSEVPSRTTQTHTLRAYAHLPDVPSVSYPWPDECYGTNPQESDQMEVSGTPHTWTPAIASPRMWASWGGVEEQPCDVFLYADHAQRAALAVQQPTWPRTSKDDGAAASHSKPPYSNHPKGDNSSAVADRYSPAAAGAESVKDDPARYPADDTPSSAPMGGSSAYSSLTASGSERRPDIAVPPNTNETNRSDSSLPSKLLNRGQSGSHTLTAKKSSPDHDDDTAVGRYFWVGPEQVEAAYSAAEQSSSLADATWTAAAAEFFKTQELSEAPLLPGVLLSWRHNPYDKSGVLPSHMVEHELLYQDALWEAEQQHSEEYYHETLQLQETARVEEMGADGPRRMETQEVELDALPARSFASWGTKLMMEDTATHLYSSTGANARCANPSLAAPPSNQPPEQGQKEARDHLEGYEQHTKNGAPRAPASLSTAHPAYASPPMFRTLEERLKGEMVVLQQRLRKPFSKAELMQGNDEVCTVPSAVGKARLLPTKTHGLLRSLVTLEKCRISSVTGILFPSSEKATPMWGNKWRLMYRGAAGDSGREALSVEARERERTPAALMVEVVEGGRLVRLPMVRNGRGIEYQEIAPVKEKVLPLEDVEGLQELMQRFGRRFLPEWRLQSALNKLVGSHDRLPAPCGQDHLQRGKAVGGGQRFPSVPREQAEYFYVLEHLMNDTSRAFYGGSVDPMEECSFDSISSSTASDQRSSERKKAVSRTSVNGTVLTLPRGGGQVFFAVSPYAFRQNGIVVLDGDRGIEMGRVLLGMHWTSLYSSSTSKTQGEEKQQHGTAETPHGWSPFEIIPALQAILRPLLMFQDGRLPYERDFLANAVYRYAWPCEVTLQREVMATLNAKVLHYLQYLQREESHLFTSCDIRAMTFVWCGFQADGQRLTVQYSSSVPVRFLELATFLFYVFHCRVWIMEVCEADETSRVLDQQSSTSPPPVAAQVADEESAWEKNKGDITAKCAKEAMQRALPRSPPRKMKPSTTDETQELRQESALKALDAASAQKKWVDVLLEQQLAQAPDHLFPKIASHVTREKLQPQKASRIEEAPQKEAQTNFGGGRTSTPAAPRCTASPLLRRAEASTGGERQRSPTPLGGSMMEWAQSTPLQTAADDVKETVRNYFAAGPDSRKEKRGEGPALPTPPPQQEAGRRVALSSLQKVELRHPVSRLMQLVERLSLYFQTPYSSHQMDELEEMEHSFPWLRRRHTRDSADPLGSALLPEREQQRLQDSLRLSPFHDVVRMVLQSLDTESLSTKSVSKRQKSKALGPALPPSAFRSLKRLQKESNKLSLIALRDGDKGSAALLSQRRETLMPVKSRDAMYYVVLERVMEWGVTRAELVGNANEVVNEPSGDTPPPIHLYLACASNRYSLNRLVVIDGDHGPEIGRVVCVMRRELWKKGREGNVQALLEAFSTSSAPNPTQTEAPATTAAAVAPEKLCSSVSSIASLALPPTTAESATTAQTATNTATNVPSPATRLLWLSEEYQLFLWDGRSSEKDDPLDDKALDDDDASAEATRLHRREEAEGETEASTPSLLGLRLCRLDGRRLRRQVCHFYPAVEKDAYTPSHRPSCIILPFDDAIFLRAAVYRYAWPFEVTLCARVVPLLSACVLLLLERLRVREVWSEVERCQHGEVNTTAVSGKGRMTVDELRSMQFVWCGFQADGGKLFLEFYQKNETAQVSPRRELRVVGLAQILFQQLGCRAFIKEISSMEN